MKILTAGRAPISSPIGVKLIGLEDIVGAFLCGIAIDRTPGHSPARESSQQE
ncbi:MAG: hypothetical protein IT577_08160 [Verrucomicrobiae bacterium]|nr:hypothetical protein [Verrucomicrobiae bacterium]